MRLAKDADTLHTNTVWACLTPEQLSSRGILELKAQITNKLYGLCSICWRTNVPLPLQEKLSDLSMFIS